MTTHTTHTTTPGILKIWDAAKAAADTGGITELQMRQISGLGVGSVSRIKNTLLANGYLQQAGQRVSDKDGKTLSTTYYASGTREAVSRALCRRPGPPKRVSVPILNGEGIGRVPSVFALAACMGFQ